MNAHWHVYILCLTINRTGLAFGETILHIFFLDLSQKFGVCILGKKQNETLVPLF